MYIYLFIHAYSSIRTVIVHRTEHLFCMLRFDNCSNYCIWRARNTVDTTITKNYIHIVEMDMPRFYFCIDYVYDYVCI